MLVPLVRVAMRGFEAPPPRRGEQQAPPQRQPQQPQPLPPQQQPLRMLAWPLGVLVSTVALLVALRRSWEGDAALRGVVALEGGLPTTVLLSNLASTLSTLHWALSG